MSPRFLIAPSGDFAALSDRILAAAEDKPSIARVDRGVYGLALIFCSSPDSARELEESFQNAGTVSDALCILTLSPERTISIDGDGADESASNLETFVRPLLHELGPYRVWDEETAEELRSDPFTAVDVLFGEGGGPP